MSDNATIEVIKQYEIIETARGIIADHNKLLQISSSEAASSILRNQIAYQEGVIRVARLEIDHLTRKMFFDLVNQPETVKQTKRPTLLTGKFVGVTDIHSGHSIDIEMKDKEIVFSLKNSQQTISWKISNAHVVDSIIGALQECRDQVFGSRGEI